MADAADIADALQAEVIDIAVRAARNAILPGISGECDRCEWWMPRLVDGLCGFCRDGRARPPDWKPPPRPDPDLPDPEDTAMAKTPAPARKPVEQPIPRVPHPVTATPRQRMMAALDQVAAEAAALLDRPDAGAAIERAEAAEREVASLREALELVTARANSLAAALDTIRGALAA